MSAVRLEDIHKTFKLRKQEPVKALRGVNLVVEPGESVAFTGHNGAGKTTLLKIISTVIVPNRGTGQVFDIPFRRHREIRKHIGLLAADERSFYWRLTGRQNLHFFGALQNLGRREIDRRVADLAERFEVDYLDRRFDLCSTGMRHHIALLRCLLHRPRLLLLDEPTRSLDIEATERFQTQMRTMLDDEERTLIVVTHNHTLARTLCDRVVTFENGVVSEEKASSDFTEALADRYIVTTEVLSDLEARALESCIEVHGLSVEPKLGRSRIQTIGEPQALSVLLRRIMDLRIPVFDVRPLAPDAVEPDAEPQAAEPRGEGASE